MSPTNSSLIVRQAGTALAAALLAAALAACGSSGSSPGSGGGAAPPASPGAGGSQAAAPAGTAAPGDIPDSTIYVPYQSAAGHLQIKVPEGWSRTTTAASTTFTSSLNSINVAWMPMTTAPTISSVRAVTVPALKAGTNAFQLQSVHPVSLTGGPAVELVYLVNSAANPVTGRRYRLVVERFELYHHGRAAVLSLSSAVGADNVDPWRIVSQSFRWR
jgi:hypothetical protein